MGLSTKWDDPSTEPVIKVNGEVMSFLEFLKLNDFADVIFEARDVGEGDLIMERTEHIRYKVGEFSVSATRTVSGSVKKKPSASHRSSKRLSKATISEVVPESSDPIGEDSESDAYLIASLTGVPPSQGKLVVSTLPSVKKDTAVITPQGKGKGKLVLSTPPPQGKGEDAFKKHKDVDVSDVIKSISKSVISEDVVGQSGSGGERVEKVEVSDSDEAIFVPD